MGFNSAFKGLNRISELRNETQKIYEYGSEIPTTNSWAYIRIKI
jgi:hypothetical protein